MSISIPPEVASKLGFYVYLYVDPRDGRPFYVGKGQEGRILDHLTEEGETEKIRRIQEILSAGLEPRLDVLAHKLPDEETAFRVEAAVIDALGLDVLTNRVRGKDTVKLGRMPLKDLIPYYAATPVAVVDPVILIRVNKLYWHGIPAQELYEATRGAWRLGPNRLKARYAFAVYESVVKAVYEIQGWHEAGTTEYLTRTPSDVVAPGRWEFTGTTAMPEVWARYVDRSVSHYLKPGSQNPIAYVNIS